MNFGKNSHTLTACIMPKTAKSLRSKATDCVRAYPQEFSVTPAGELFCQRCCTTVQCDKMYFIDKHRATAKHNRARTGSTSTSSVQEFIHGEGAHDFARDVAKAFLSADIPLWKLRNAELRRLFSNIGHPLPSEETCRTRIPKLYEEEILRVRAHVKEKPMFLIVDEADMSGQKFVNVLVGILEKPGETFLCECLPLTKSPDSGEIVRLINDVIPFLGCDRLDVCLLLTDAAPYMMAAARTLRVIYPRMFHVMCAAHLMHNCAMRVRAHFDNVDALIARVKASVVKNESRRRLFDDVGQPPAPIVTRWASWINAAVYYADKLPEVRAIFDSVHGGGLLTTRVKDILQDQQLATNLLTIKTCYHQLATCVAKFESSSFTIAEAFDQLQALNFGNDPCGIRLYLEKRLRENDMSTIV
ncbi:MAG: hypothetical protein AAGK05_12180, partial [Pseudomonadota bacterium]